MTINIDSQKAFDPTLIISIIALISSWVAICLQIYFQFFRKIKKLILNIFTYNLTDFSNYPDQHRDIAKNKISLSNSGNTSILIVSINYQTINLQEIISTYETHLHPSNIPLLLKPGETVLYDVISKPDLFFDIIKSAETTDNGAFKFDVYIKFVVIANDKSNNYRILIHKTQFYNPQKVHHQYSGKLEGIDILDKKNRVEH